MTEIELRALTPSDAPAVADLLTADPPEYRAHFQPLPADPTEIASEIERARDDRYWGLFADGEHLAGLVMLRGLDSGFATPAFGVYVAHECSGRGLGTLALAFAQAWCRLNDLAEIMLTVDPENTRARRMYERDGFVADGQHSDIGHLIYRKRLTNE